jgi:hypothetical protein
MIYCCDKFEFEVGLPSTTGPNIRIVEFLPHKDWNEKKIFLGFFVTMGYQKFNLDVPNLRISHCPFCGKNLKTFYTNSSYANETEGETFE